MNVVGIEGARRKEIYLFGHLPPRLRLTVGFVACNIYLSPMAQPFIHPAITLHARHGGCGSVRDVGAWTQPRDSNIIADENRPGTSRQPLAVG